MHKRIRPYRRTLSVCDSLCECRLSLVGTFELTNHFRIRYNIFFDPRCPASQSLLPLEIGLCSQKRMTYSSILRNANAKIIKIPQSVSFLKKKMWKEQNMRPLTQLRSYTVTQLHKVYLHCDFERKKLFILLYIL